MVGEEWPVMVNKVYVSQSLPTQLTILGVYVSFFEVSSSSFVALTNVNNNLASITLETPPAKLSRGGVSASVDSLRESCRDIARHVKHCVSRGSWEESAPFSNARGNPVWHCHLAAAVLRETERHGERAATAAQHQFREHLWQ
jgi:hypothetical protein